MELFSQYATHFKSPLQGRFISLKHIQPLLKNWENNFKIKVGGISELGADIPYVKIGNGKIKVLAWSQMHGNESTTTKALFDFFTFLTQKKLFQEQIRHFLNKYTLYAIPILNPDGATLYTRKNINNVDLNRDAQLLSQKESQMLRQLFDAIQPNLCLNLHDQRTIYGFDSGKPATISFLAPAASKEREVTSSRKEAMKLIVKMHAFLKQIVPHQVGRYDDSFNSACVGDTFQMAGVPTILFEAGHYALDYKKEKTREYIFYAFLALFDIIKEEKMMYNYKEYFLLPENKKNFKDIILKNVKVGDTITSITIQYVEVLIDTKIHFLPIVDKIGDLLQFYGHIEVDAKGEEILINSQNNIEIGLEILSINIKNTLLPIFFNK